MQAIAAPAHSTTRQRPRLAVLYHRGLSVCSDRLNLTGPRQGRLDTAAMRAVTLLGLSLAVLASAGPAPTPTASAAPPADPSQLQAPAQPQAQAQPPLDAQ